MSSNFKTSVSYKKQNGSLSVSRDNLSVSFCLANSPASSPALTISVQDITNFQKSPETAQRVSVKFVVQPPNATTAENHVFAFTSPTDARAEQAAIVDAIRDMITASKSNQGSATPNAGADTRSASAAMAIAHAVSSVPSVEEDQFSDSKLLSDSSLQRSLLNSNPQLRQRFEESLKSKPDVIPLSQFSAQFWSTRVHLLRSHAVEMRQSQGTYNVLSEVKVRNVDGADKLNLSKEQIQLIFKQHPLVRKIYNEVVPRKFDESKFWGKFFVSRVFKQLKGERIDKAMDPPIPELDKYLDFDESDDRTRQFEVSSVPRFMDIGGNEQDHRHWMTSAPEIAGPSSHEKFPIVRALNLMSEKMMVNVAPSDAEIYAPAGMDEKTFNQLELRDLDSGERDNRVMLNVSSLDTLQPKDSRFKDTQSSTVDPEKAIRLVSRALAPEPTPVGDYSDTAQSQATEAFSTVMHSVRNRISLRAEQSENAMGVSTARLDAATMTHNTTVEFLHYFWSIFLSGNEGRVGELSKLAETLDKCLERMQAAANDAEAERQKSLDSLRRQQEEFTKRTGRKRKFDASSVGGGGDKIRKLLAATELAVRHAQREYADLYKQQSAAPIL